MMKKENAYSDTTIKLNNIESMIGAVIEKTSTISKCIGIKDFLNQKGDVVTVYIWETELKETGQKKTYSVKAYPLRIGDIRSTKKAFKLCN